MSAWTLVVSCALFALAYSTFHFPSIALTWFSREHDHKVKGINLSKFTNEELYFLQQSGNKVCEKFQ